MAADKSGAPHETRSPTDVLQNARQILNNTKRGLDDILSGDPTRGLPGLHNVVVFGRAVTIALQRLRHIVTDFDQWYGSWVPSEKDPLLTYMNELRNGLLKQAEAPQVTTSMYVEHFSGTTAQMLQGPPPEGAVGGFIGEAGTGGSGWRVRLADGTEVKYYAALSPAFQATVTNHLPDAPTTFLDKELPDTSVPVITGAYVTWLDAMVTDAEKRFTQS